jgi:hypothetical protein
MPRLIDRRRLHATRRIAMEPSRPSPAPAQPRRRRPPAVGARAAACCLALGLALAALAAPASGGARPAAADGGTPEFWSESWLDK